MALRMNGSEAAELLAIVGGMLAIAAHRRDYGCFVLRIDSQNAINHVFERIDPTTRDGRDLIPGISRARALYQKLQDLNVQVRYAKVPSKENLAHHVAKAEQEYRLRTGWGTSEDRWPPDIPTSFREVFELIARNRTGGGHARGVPGDALEYVRREERVRLGKGAAGGGELHDF